MLTRFTGLCRVRSEPARTLQVRACAELLSACRGIAGAELLPTVGRVDLPGRDARPAPRRCRRGAGCRSGRTKVLEKIRWTSFTGAASELSPWQWLSAGSPGCQAGCCYDHGQLVVADRLGTREGRRCGRVLPGNSRGTCGRGGEGADLAVLQVPAPPPQAVAGSCRVDHVLA